MRAAALLDSATILCDDFERVLRGKFDAIISCTWTLHTTYHQGEFSRVSSLPFSEADFHRLSDTLVQIDWQGASFDLNYPDCVFISQLRKRWNVAVLNIRRTIASHVAARRRTCEVLLFNYDL